MPQPRKSTRVPTRPAVTDLAPLLDELIRSEIQAAIARSSEVLAAQVHARIVAALTGGGASGKPARTARPATAAKVAKRGGARGGTAKRASGPAEAGCHVKGCARPHRSKGYCAAHYQSARKHGWPTPCPAGFEAPVLKRGRPARNPAAAGA